MPFQDVKQIDELKKIWTDRLVTVKAENENYQRFAGRVGRVVTVNFAGKAIVDFADGAWYDLPASEEYLVVLGNEDPLRSKYDAKRNSAQSHPDRQG